MAVGTTHDQPVVVAKRQECQHAAGCANILSGYVQILEPVSDVGKCGAGVKTLFPFASVPHRPIKHEKVD
jgi:hypothetical protein